MNRFRRVAVTAAVLAITGLLSAPGSPALAEECVGGVESDFDGDGVKDIAIGEANGYVGGITAGEVIVLYSGGLRQEISQAHAGVPGEPEDGDLFGVALASYDHNRDGCSDLVVGAPGEDLGNMQDAGTVAVIPGSPRGLWTGGSFSMTQDSAGVPGTAEPNDRFGRALAAGSTRSGEPFLVVGVPDENIGRSGADEGAVHYIRGDLSVLVHQDTPGVPGTAEWGDDFGQTLDATRDHVVVVSPTEGIVVDGQNRVDAGMVHVFGHGFSATGSPAWARDIHQNTTGISGTPEAGDEFAGDHYAEGGVTAVPYRPDGVTDGDAGSLIAVGVPQEDTGPHDAGHHQGEGIVHLLYVTRAGKVNEVRTLHQDTPGVTGTGERSDGFGDEVLLRGHQGNEPATSGTAKLVVAVPREVADDADGAYQLFSLAGQPGDGDIWIGNRTFGLQYTGEQIGSNIGVTDTDLYLEGPLWWEVTVVPWANIVDGAAQPVRSISPNGETGGLVGIAME